jgi:hypothetical protein
LIKTLPVSAISREDDPGFCWSWSSFWNKHAQQHSLVYLNGKTTGRQDPITTRGVFLRVVRRPNLDFLHFTGVQSVLRKRIVQIFVAVYIKGWIGRTN